MKRAMGWILFGLVLAATFSATAVVHAKYLTRKHFVQLQELRAQRDDIDVEWNRLRLEEAALTTYARVESKAREALGMYPPGIGEVLLIEEAPRDTP